MQKYVAGFMFTPSKEKVVLIRKAKPAWQRGKLNGVGGKVEPGETPLDAMVREFEEETGVIHTRWEPTLTLTRENHFEVSFFRTFSDNALSVTSKEEEEVGLYLVGNLNRFAYTQTIRNLSWVIPLNLDPDVKFPILMSEK